VTLVGPGLALVCSVTSAYFKFNLTHPNDPPLRKLLSGAMALGELTGWVTAGPGAIGWVLTRRSGLGGNEPARRQVSS
jgi:hypothetical protein